MAEAARTVQPFLAGRLQGGTRTILTSIPVGALRANPEQPRRHFDAQALEELAASIRVRGILQPIIVKREGDGFLIMAGERRYRAAQMAGLATIPALVRDDNPMEVAIIENLQRENLSPLEEAEGFQALAVQTGHTHEEIARLIGKSRPYVSNSIAICRLPDGIKGEVHETPGVSREILVSLARAESPEKQAALWHLTKMRKLSVQRFRSEQAGKAGAYPELVEVAKLVRKLGRKLRALETAELPAEQRRHLARLMEQAQRRIARTLVKLRAGQPDA